ncbi:MAG TPA: alcohol dehydrogenase catalytic domain-containing protein [Anaerolineales bacterium]|nr:alcohol dehydrogenase catalytic domain-containing protein [Anaerolineales bacterium]
MNATVQRSVPSTMHALQLDEPNGKLALRLVPVPRPGAGQVLIRMAAAPINPSDLGALSGSTYRGKRTYPFTPGLEGSGTVVEGGAGMLPRLMRGRRVACAAPLNGDGTWAEYMVTSARQCMPLSKNVSLEEGAMLLVNPLTALAIFEIARRGKHGALVSTAAASALGGMILRLGKRYSMPVIHVVRRQEQVEHVRRVGGECVLNSSDADFTEQLRALAGSLHATLLLDAIAGSMTKQLAEAAPYGSTILLYSRLSGQDSVIDPVVSLSKSLRFEGWFLANWLGEKSLFKILQLSRQAQWLLATDLHSPIHKKLLLAEGQGGLETYINQMTAGKVLLIADPQQVQLD